LRRCNRVVEFSYVELMKGQNCEKAQRGLQHTRGEAPTTEFWPKPDGVPAFAVTSNEGRGESTMSLIKQTIMITSKRPTNVGTSDNDCGAGRGGDRD
jgi:hypothetical protein